MSRTLAILAALSALALAGSADAKQCRDEHGRFAHCPAPPHQCRDNHGRFARCEPDKAGHPKGGSIVHAATIDIGHGSVTGRRQH